MSAAATGEDLLPSLFLTAVELDVLGAAHLRSLGEPDPSGGQLDDVQAQARLSLMSRGLLDADGELMAAGVVGQALCLMLDIRVGVPSVLVVDRVLGAAPGGAQDGEREGAQDGAQESRSTRVLHVMDIGACVEDIDPLGLHQLTLLPGPEDHVEALTGFLLPPDAAAAEGPPVDGSGHEAHELLQRLGRPTVIGEAFVLRRGSDDADSQVDSAHLVSAGPGGCFVGERRSPDPHALPCFEPVSPEQITAWAEEMIAAVRFDTDEEAQ